MTEDCAKTSKSEKTGLGIAHYPSDPDIGVGMDRVLAYSYWNLNGCGIVIVAREGYASDWAAYIGALPSYHTEQDAIRNAAKYGAKLAKNQAVRWFPQLPEHAYRP